MKKIITSFLMAILAIGVWAEDPEDVFNFVDQDNFKACTVTNSISSVALSYSSYAGIYAYVQTPSNYTTYEYIIVSPENQLEGQNQYALYITPSIYSGWAANKSFEVKVFFGQGENLEQYEQFGSCDVTESSYNGKHHEFTFGIENTGNYKIAVQAGGKGVTPKFAELKLVKIGVTQIPLAVSDFSINPDAEGLDNATISFTLPSKTESYADLGNIKYTVSRTALTPGAENEAIIIKDQVEGTPGEKVEFVDHVPENNSSYEYSVFVTNGDKESKKVTGQSYIGLDIPSVPTNVELNVQDNAFVVSWDAPTIGVNGITLSPDKLIYTITRILDGDATIVEENLSNATSYTDAFAYTGLHNIQYSIKAKYTVIGQFSSVVETPRVNIGNVSLPYAYSFANGEIDFSWTNEVLVPTQDYPTYKWQGKDIDKNAFFMNAQTNDREYIDITPYDEDGGMAMYYTSSKGNSARLISPSIVYANGQKPVLTFARFINVADANDILKIQISVDRGEWQDVDGAQYENGNADQNKWVEETVDFSNYLSDKDKEYRIAFLVINSSNSIPKGIYIDAIHIIKQTEKDLAIESLTVSEKAHAGDFLTLNVRVANNGMTEVAASDYTIEIEHDFTDEIVISELQPISSLSSVAYEVIVPVHALHLHGANEFNFVAKVNYDGDQEPDNNVSDSQKAVSSYSKGLGVKIEKSTFDEDGNYYLYWESVKDTSHEPVSMVESFEGIEMTKDSPVEFGPFNGWTTIDKDGINDSFSGAGGKQFNLQGDWFYNREGRDGHNVLVLGCNGQQDDWIVSPLIDCKEGNALSLDFLLGMAGNYLDSKKFEFEILYCTENTYNEEEPIESFTGEVQKFSILGNDAKVNGKLHRFEVEEPIPAEAKYVAIHFFSNISTSYCLMFDHVRLMEFELNPLLGYHVYSFEVGGRLNAEMIDADETEFVFKPEATQEPANAKHRAASINTSEPHVFVAAVYADGEAKPENVWNYAEQSTTGIENVAVDAVDEATAEYFNLQGMKVKSDNLTPGIYIIRSNGTSQKVLVK